MYFKKKQIVFAKCTETSDSVLKNVYDFFQFYSCNQGCTEFYTGVENAYSNQLRLNVYISTPL